MWYNCSQDRPTTRPEEMQIWIRDHPHTKVSLFKILKLIRDLGCCQAQGSLGERGRHHAATSTSWWPSSSKLPTFTFSDSLNDNVNCLELLKTLKQQQSLVFNFSTQASSHVCPLQRVLTPAPGSFNKMMIHRPKHQFLENQHFLDMEELCVQASAAVKAKKRVVATTSSLVIHIQHQLSRFEMQGIKIIALSPNLCNSLHSKKTTTVALFCFCHFSSPSSSLHQINGAPSFCRLMLTNFSFFSPPESCQHSAWSFVNQVRQ